MGKRVAVYARVSTTRQAENDISIPDQLAQAKRYCQQRGWHVVREFVDAGASARDDKRPELRRMMDAACVDPSPIDVVLVHSQSRFFRDTAGYVFFKKKLQKHGVLLVSMTQDFGQGPSAEFAETIIAAADALNSAETAKHVTRTMLENARQGFWNGSRPPLGYKTVEVEKRGQRVKKHLAIDAREAAIVRRIFKLFREGDGSKGPMGIKDITSWLNRNNIRFRNDKPFYMGTVHRILTRPTYAGTHHYNREDSRARKARPKEEWVAIKVPSIIPTKVFKDVQKRLRERRPRVTPTRTTSSEVLLTGIVRCESCGSPLMLRTGKSGRYRYYACAGHRLKGCAACNDPIAIPERQLDQLVLTALTDQLLTPARLTTLLNQAIKHRRKLASAHSTERAALRTEMKSLEGQLERLIRAVAEGTMPDLPMVRGKMDTLSVRREECAALLSKLDEDLPEYRQVLSNGQATSIAAVLKRRLLEGSKALQKRYVHGLVSDIIVDHEKAVISGAPAHVASAVSAPDHLGEVRTSVREWRTGQDSNRTPSDDGTDRVVRAPSLSRVVEWTLPRGFRGKLCDGFHVSAPRARWLR